MENEPQSRTASGARLPKPPLTLIYTIQLILLVIAGLLVHTILGWPDDDSIVRNAVIGGLISWLGNAWFARMAFRYSGARHMQQITRSLYLGETGKFVLTASLFVIVFVLVKPLQPIALFLGYVVMTVINTAFAQKIVIRQKKQFFH